MGCGGGGVFALMRPASARRPRPADMTVPVGARRVFTDGACSGNPGPGGWAWALSTTEYAAGHEAASTNQRMEIRAALEAVRANGGPLLVVSDSTCVVNCFRDAWHTGWLERGWLTSAKEAGCQQGSLGTPGGVGERARQCRLPMGKGPFRP